MKRSSYMFQEMATVLVGSEKVTFSIHVDNFDKRSAFFKAACSGTWNADQKPIELLDKDPEVFSNYLRCVYQGDLDVAEETLEEYFLQLAQLYVLADALGDLQSLNMVIDRIMEFSDENMSLPGAKCVKFVMEATPENSPPRRLMLDYYLREAKPNRFYRDKDGEEIPDAFLAAVAREFGPLKSFCLNGGDFEDTFDKEISKEKCCYHQHDPSFPRCDAKEENSDG